MGQEILGDGLLHLTVPDKFLVLQDMVDRTVRPELSVNGPLPLIIEHLRDRVCGLSQKELLEDEPDNLCLFGNDLPFPIWAFGIADHPFKVDVGFSGLEALLDGPSNVVGNAPALILGQGRKDRQDQLSLSIQRVDMFLFKIDPDRWIHISKLSDAA